MPELPRLAAWLRKRAHRGADSSRHDPLRADVMRFLDAMDAGRELPSGWSLGETSGRGSDDRD